MNFDGRREGLETLKPQLVPEVSLVVNDAVVLLQGSSGLYLVKVVDDSPHRGRKTLRWCFKANNIADTTSRKAVGWQRDNVFGNINRFRMLFFFTLVDEIYSYQVFLLLLLFIPFGSELKPVAIFVFYLNLQLFRILLLLLSE